MARVRFGGGDCLVPGVGACSDRCWHVGAFLLALPLSGGAVAQEAVPVPPLPRSGPVTAWTMLGDSLARSQANWRTMAILHVAMHDALNAATPRYARFLPAATDEPAVDGADPAVALAAAAFQVLLARHPEEALQAEAIFRAALRAAAAPDAAAEAGIRLGAAIGLGTVARLTLISPMTERFPTSEVPGRWRPTPPFLQIALVADFRPFLAPTSAALRGPPPPAFGSPGYQVEVEEIRRLGAEHAPARSPAETEAAQFWDRQTSQRGFVQLAIRLLADRPQADAAWGEARLLAQLSLALADSFVIAWDEKRYWSVWRPVMTINLGGGGVEADRRWEPLVPTPPHPDYPSGHATDCAAAAAVLSGAFGPALGPITYVAVDARPPEARRFPSVLAAAEECAASRLWAGVHFRSAQAEGQRLGRAIAARALAALPPLPASATRRGE
jgi:hypothetical protein